MATPVAAPVTGAVFGGGGILFRDRGQGLLDFRNAGRFFLAGEHEGFADGSVGIDRCCSFGWVDHNDG